MISLISSIVKSIEFSKDELIAKLEKVNFSIAR